MWGDMAWNSNSPGLLLSEFRLQHIGRKEETITDIQQKEKDFLRGYHVICIV